MGNCHPTHIWTCMQLHTLFVVQSKKTEEMEKVSRGYGLLLSASGLRTEEMRAQYSIKMKEKVYHKWHLSYSLTPGILHFHEKMMQHATFSPVRYMGNYWVLKPAKKWKKPWRTVVKTILGKSLSSHGSLWPSQTHSSSASQRNLILRFMTLSMATGTASVKMNLCILDQLYTETIRGRWLVRDG